MATLGDPLTDVGLLIVYQRMDRLGEGPMASAAPGYPSVAEVLACTPQPAGGTCPTLASTSPSPRSRRR